MILLCVRLVALFFKVKTTLLFSLSPFFSFLKQFKFFACLGPNQVLHLVCLDKLLSSGRIALTTAGRSCLVQQHRKKTIIVILAVV